MAGGDEEVVDVRSLAEVGQAARRTGTQSGPAAFETRGFERRNQFTTEADQFGNGFGSVALFKADVLFGGPDQGNPLPRILDSSA